jgi:hypothetical protein
MFPYRIDMATQEEIDGDPFGGAGVFLSLPGASGEDILAALERAFGRVIPAVAWAEHGAWADSGAAGLGKDELLAAWHALVAP